MAEDRKLEFMWKLFCLHLAGVPNTILDEHVNAMYAESLDLDGAFESAVDRFALSHDRNLLDMAIVDAVKQRCFSTRRHVQLAAVLVGRELISLDAVATLLVARGSDLEQMPKAVEHALDVAWLVNEDQRDGVMGVDADNLLKDALASVAIDFLGSLPTK